MNPVTLDDFLLLCTKVWDEYLEVMNVSEISLMFYRSNSFFRRPNVESAKIYQQTCVILDACSLVGEAQRFDKLHLCLAVIYCVVNIYNKSLSEVEVANFRRVDEFPE